MFRLKDAGTDLDASWNETILQQLLYLLNCEAESIRI